MNLISVIIPVYNLEGYLKECIDSVIENTQVHIEIILVNDGSTDNSQNICEDYAGKYKNITVINKENGGLSEARNTGIKAARGEYILFLDADDLLEDGILNYLSDFIYFKNMPDAVMFDYTKFYQKKNKYERIKKDIMPQIINKKSKEELIEYLLSSDTHFQWLVCQFIYKRELLLENKLFFQKNRLYEDILWLPEVIFYLKRVEYFTQSVYIYRLERDGQITSTISKKSLLDNIYIPIYWKSKIDKMKINKKIKNKLMESFSLRYFYSIWFLDFLDKDEKIIVLKNLKNNKIYLRYTSSRITKITKILTKVIGISLTSKLFKYLILAKRKLT